LNKSLREDIMTNEYTNSSLSVFEQETLPHKSVLYQAAYSLLGSRGEAEDAVQETYLQAWKSFQTFQTGTNCRAWMFSILFNVVRHQRRKWIFRFCLTNEPNVFEKTVPAVRPAADELTDPEILAALRKLPESYAEVVILADVQEFSYKEISVAIGCPIGTVMSRISRGRELLRKALTSVAEQRGILRAKRPVPQNAVVV
jgi:RNA polymerase sigma-70 factor, ECF subfamily